MEDLRPLNRAPNLCKMEDNQSQKLGAILLASGQK